MNKTNRQVLTFLLLISVLGHTAKGDILGADIALLSQILAQSINQLTQLKQILGSGEDTLARLYRVRGFSEFS